jgi:hypothetical protein
VRGAQSGDAGQRKALKRAEEQLAAAEESLADLARKLAAARDELKTDMFAQVGLGGGEGGNSRGDGWARGVAPGHHNAA